MRPKGGEAETRFSFMGSLAKVECRVKEEVRLG